MRLSVRGAHAHHAALVAALAGLLVGGCAGYGGQTAGAPGDGVREFQTDGEHCRVTLPDGWTWYPAQWTATSPLGTDMSFVESLYGRPQYPNWEDAKRTTIANVTQRSPSATIAEDEDTVRVDYGPDGGLMVLQRFDRVGCQVTFSRVAGARAREIDQWETIIASLERTSPTPNFTPVSTP